MLAPTRASAVLRRAPRLPLCCVSRPSALVAYYSTEPAPAPEFSRKTLDAPLVKAKRVGRANQIMSEEDRKAHHQRSVFIKPWDGIKSMVEAFAILRAVERKYGRLREYKFIRDADLITEYQYYFAADFVERESWDAVPKEGSQLRVVVPAHDAKQPGGLGLAALRPLLEPTDRPTGPEVPGWDETHARVDADQKAGRIMEVRIEHAKTPFQYMTRVEPIMHTRNYKIAVGHKFLAWGGFARPLPAPAKQTETADPSAPQIIPRHRMHAARRKWISIVGDDYPKITHNSTTEQTEAKIRERPVRAPADASEPQAVSRPEPQAAPTPPQPPSAQTLMERERRKKLREQWEQFSYPMPGMGASTAAVASAASASPETPSKTSESPSTTGAAPQKQTDAGAKAQASRKERLLQKAEGQPTQVKARNAGMRKEESAVEPEKPSLSRRLTDLFGRW